MKLEDAETHIKTLADKAAKAEKSDDALKFSQSATNLANALITLEEVRKPRPASTAKAA